MKLREIWLVVYQCSGCDCTRDYDSITVRSLIRLVQVGNRFLRQNGGVVAGGELDPALHQLNRRPQ